MSKKIELVLSGTYIYRGKVFEKGQAYAIPDADANHLLEQLNEREIPYFRLSDAEDVVEPSHKRTDKGGKPAPAPKADTRAADRIEADEEVTETVVAPKKKKAAKKTAKKAAKKTASKKPVDDVSDDEVVTV